MKSSGLLLFLFGVQSASSFSLNPKASKFAGPKKSVDASTGATPNRCLGFMAAAFVSSLIVFSPLPQPAVAFEVIDESDYTPIEKLQPKEAVKVASAETSVEEPPAPAADVTKEERALEEAEFKLGELNEEQMDWLRNH